MKNEISEASLQRLPVYLNYLKTLGDGERFISSGAIARALNMGEVLVRKDLAFTSAQGRTRVGYKLSELVSALEEYLGCNEKKNTVIIGAGEVGQALLAYGGFKNYGIEIVAAFDSDEKKNKHGGFAKTRKGYCRIKAGRGRIRGKARRYLRSRGGCPGSGGLARELRR